MNHTEWLLPPDDLALTNNGVHIWRASLTQSPQFIQTMRQVLSQDEAERADRFYFEKDRNHYTVGRGILRHLLGRYLTVAPTAIRFRYNKYGRPDLEDTQNPTGLCFNLSHSGEKVLYAFTHTQQIGVDIERIRPLEDMMQIASRFFSPSESAQLETIPANLQHQAFFNCWTRKEAYIKAQGQGLSIPLDQFNVTLAPDAPVRLLSVHTPEENVEQWSMHGLAPGEGYIAALAIDRRNPVLKLWDYR